jgi:hypothetical protein
MLATTALRQLFDDTDRHADRGEPLVSCGRDRDACHPSGIDR